MCHAAQRDAARERSKKPMNAHHDTPPQQQQEQRYNGKPFLMLLDVSNKVGTKGGFFLKGTVSFSTSETREKRLLLPEALKYAGNGALWITQALSL